MARTPKQSSTANTNNKSSNGTNLGFEAKLWAAANALRNNMDAAEYKHDEAAIRIRDDVGFFQAVRAVLAKSAPGER